MAKAAAFNSIANESASQLKKFKKAIELFKDLKSWGTDDDGKRFKFEAFYEPLMQKTMLLGTYGYNSQDNVPAVFIGGSTNAHGEFECIIGRKSKNTSPAQAYIDQLAQGNYMSRHCTAASVHLIVEDFIKSRMANHPRFHEAFQTGAQKTIRSIKAKPVFE